MPLSSLISKKQTKDKTNKQAVPDVDHWNKLKSAVKNSHVVVQEVQYSVDENVRTGLDFTNVVSKETPEAGENSVVYSAAEYINLEECVIDNLNVYNLNIKKGSFKTEEHTISKNVICMIASCISQSLFYYEGHYPSLAFQVLPYSTKWNSEHKINEVYENCISLRVIERGEDEARKNFDEIVAMRRSETSSKSSSSEESKPSKTVVKKSMPTDL